MKKFKQSSTAAAVFMFWIFPSSFCLLAAIPLLHFSHSYSWILYYVGCCFYFFHFSRFSPININLQSFSQININLLFLIFFLNFELEALGSDTKQKAENHWFPNKILLKVYFSSEPCGWPLRIPCCQGQTAKADNPLLSPLNHSGSPTA